ncbi:hypothetical protein LPJ77_000134 [Coemansia sp. RSA 2523]|nr:hypothetical protein LPJ69_003517 [Coemansia sp. RSA 1752]KAJ1774950.1 hypothetical protein LPJ54_003987 [Coemansia sp. RSA 1824]KAJ1786695.1 hypothetical protein LPJ67_003473 [Coemansia sp. RSA 1938]KAJ1811270.1 hypothetical protein LPJ77_000134 [Coemansia sp. RSA 2523]KAJ2148327.1 hypothetical protein IW142_001005 [Coemansia sp. RSA 564]KAJ2149810.1 hypothetical protein J3F82_004362 [Coemansia sp. RSA 637]KAJ2166914.1 hypothetical protein GGH15_002455 [Coemansia sp. RSA 562]KAJ2185604.1
MAERKWTDWQYTRDELKQTPSVASGWTVEREEMDRAKACTLVYAAARKLQLPQITSASACVYLHRFFMRHSLKEYHHYNVAATCLFLACKAEESLRKLDVFIPVIAYYASKGHRKAVVGTSEYDKWRSVIVTTEPIVLEALCFDMVVDHPHVSLVHMLERTPLDERRKQMAWSFVADCMRVPVCLVHEARTVAGAAVELAMRVAPEQGDNAVLDGAGVRRAEVESVVQWLLEFYAREAQARRPVTEAVQTPASSPASPTVG